MASNMDPAPLIARSKTLINNDLKKICKEEGQVQSGNKAQLQSRVIALITSAVSRGDTDAVQRLRYRLNNHGEAPPSSGATATPATQNFGDSSAPPNVYTGMAASYRTVYGAPIPQTTGLGRSFSIFKSSPFYEIRDPVLRDVCLDPSPTHRQTLSRTVTLSSDICERMRQDPTLKLFLFAYVDQALANYALHDIAFPAQLEVKVNNDEVRSNFKGLKNKPGTTRPADITDLVRKSPAGYKNNLTITYALTQKKYYFFVYLVRKFSVKELAKKITERNVITKQSVLAEMRKKAADPDIEVSSINMKLKDPVSTLRISIPCRSTVCSHSQCFDAESFLQLQEQAPTWVCPICNKTVSFEALAVDQYFQEILQQVPRTTEQVTIEPDGRWSYGDGASNNTPSRGGTAATNGTSHYDSDDDLIDITDHRISAIKSEAVPTPQSLSNISPMPSREPSSAPRPGSKRKSEVIDLTLSDDEEPPRPAKKVSYNNSYTPASTTITNTLPVDLTASRGGYHTPPSYLGTSTSSSAAAVPNMRPPPYSSSSSLRPTGPSTVSGNGLRLDRPPARQPQPLPPSLHHYTSSSTNSSSSYRPGQPPPPPQSSRNGYAGGSAGYPAYLGSSP